jgi:3-hydroxyisobutyrate dehydrogenase-like beta-hydroxyacid dehydrogenase
MEIGFIGLGNMGWPMARRLIEAGHQLTVFDARPEAIARLTALGAQAASSAADVADRVETVVASLPTPDIVLAVATGPRGVIEGKRVRRFVDLSTTGSRVAKEIAQKLKARNIVQIDCPVSGGVAGAEKGTLALMMAGPRAECEYNLLSATSLAASSEAMVMGVKAGLDPSVMVDVLNASSGRNAATMEKFPRDIIPGTFKGGFATGLMLKDVRLCLEEAEAMGLAMEIGKMVRAAWQRTNDAYGPQSDFTLIVQPLERDAGVEVRNKAKSE